MQPEVVRCVVPQPTEIEDLKVEKEPLPPHPPKEEEPLPPPPTMPCEEDKEDKNLTQSNITVEYACELSFPRSIDMCSFKNLCGYCHASTRNAKGMSKVNDHNYPDLHT